MTDGDLPGIDLKSASAEVVLSEVAGGNALADAGKAPDGKMAPAKSRRGRPRKPKKARPSGKGKTGRPRRVRENPPTPWLFNAVMAFLVKKTPETFQALMSIEDTRRHPELCRYPAPLLRLCELFWMLIGGVSGLDYDGFLLSPQVIEDLGAFLHGQGLAVERDGDGMFPMPSVDTLKDDMENIPPDRLAGVWRTLVRELDRLGMFRGTRFDNMPVVAIDGVDGFRTVSEIPTLLHRKTSRRKDGKVEYYEKFSLASLCHITGGAGYPIAGKMIRNKTEDKNGRKTGDVDGDATKQECEYNAIGDVVKSVIALLGNEHPILFLVDGLYLDGKIIRMFDKNNASFGIVLKDDDAVGLHLAAEEKLQAEGRHIKCRYAYGNIAEEYEIWYCNGVKYDFNGLDTPPVNYLYVIIKTFKDESETGCTKFSWITNVRLKDENAVETSALLRRRWGVETMNNDLENLAMNLNHKFDSRGEGPANFATMQFTAALFQAVMRDSDYMEKQDGCTVLPKIGGLAMEDSTLAVDVIDDLGKKQTAAGNAGQVAEEDTPERLPAAPDGKPEVYLDGKDTDLKTDGDDARTREGRPCWERVRLLMDRKRRCKAIVARIRLLRRWHTRAGWCECLRESMDRYELGDELMEVPDFTMLYNLTPPKK